MSTLAEILGLPLPPKPKAVARKAGYLNKETIIPAPRKLPDAPPYLPSEMVVPVRNPMGILARPPENVVRIQATPPPIGRVYHLQARPPHTEPPVIRLPGIGMVTPDQHRMTEAERPPKETIIELPKKKKK